MIKPDPIQTRQLVVGVVGGVLIGRWVADLIGLPSWVGGLALGGATVARAAGVDGGRAAPVLDLLSRPGAAVAGALYPPGLVLLDSPPEP